MSFLKTWTSESANLMRSSYCIPCSSVFSLLTIVSPYRCFRSVVIDLSSRVPICSSFSGTLSGRKETGCDAYFLTLLFTFYGRFLSAFFGLKNYCMLLNLGWLAEYVIYLSYSVISLESNIRLLRFNVDELAVSAFLIIVSSDCNLTLPP